MPHGRPPARVTTRCKVEKWDADSGEVLDAQTCVRTLASIFSPLLSLVSDNCHSHRNSAHFCVPLFGRVRFCLQKSCSYESSWPSTRNVGPTHPVDRCRSEERRVGNEC